MYDDIRGSDICRGAATIRKSSTGCMGRARGRTARLATAHRYFAHGERAWEQHPQDDPMQSSLNDFPSERHGVLHEAWWWHHHIRPSARPQARYGTCMNRRDRNGPFPIPVGQGGLGEPVSARDMNERRDPSQPSRNRETATSHFDPLRAHEVSSL